MDKEELAFADEQFERLARAMGMSIDELEPLRIYAENPAMALNILLSRYRRIRDVAELQIDGKLDMSGRSSPDRPVEPPANSN